MAGFFLLVETEDYRLPDHLSPWETVLHLLYESALLALSEERIAREIKRWKEVHAAETRWRHSWRRRCWLLALRGGATYVTGGVLAWGSLGMTGDWAQIAFWGGLLLSNAGPFAFGYAFWMRESGMWS